MKDIISPFALSQIRDRYLAGVADAEAKFKFNASDEDSLTGALGQALITSRPIAVSDPAGNFVFQIQYQRVRGKGPFAPENTFGPDGTFEIEVYDQNGNSLRKKGLPFQAKKNWKTSKQKLTSQASDMLSSLGTGIVIDYTAKGYSACTAQAVLDAKGSRKQLAQQDQLKSLGQLLGNEFLNCEIGKIDLIYDQRLEKFQTTSSPLLPEHVIRTEIKRLSGQP